MRFTSEEVNIIGYIIFDGYIPAGGMKKIIPHGVRPAFQWKSKLGLQKCAKEFIEAYRDKLDLPNFFRQMTPAFARAKEWTVRIDGEYLVSYFTSEEGILKLRFFASDEYEFIRVQDKEACLRDLKEELECAECKNGNGEADIAYYFYEGKKQDKEYWRVELSSQKIMKLFETNFWKE